MKVSDSDVLAWVRGQRKMSKVLGAFGPLDFIMLRPPYPLIQYPRFTAARKKNLKIKEINGS
jgi:hypothetical protein